MAELHKAYPHSPMLLYNLANDIVEMQKGRVTQDGTEQFAFVVEMYGKKTSYQFRFTKQPDGCLLSITTPDDGDKVEQRLSLMFAIVDNMLMQASESGKGQESSEKNPTN